MKTSDPCTELLNALLAARLDFPTITRNREGFSKRGGQQYQYADLNVIIDTTVPILGQHGLMLVQSVEDSAEGQLRITSTLFHAASGQWLSSEFSVAKPENMQDFGSACTYGKRYAQQALLNISTEDDDDAASLNGSSKVPAEKAVTTPAASTNGHSPMPPVTLEVAVGDRPTDAHISALRALALQDCAEPEDVQADRIRRAMGLKAGASMAPKLLTRTMSMAQFMTVFEFYTQLKAQLARKAPEVTHGPTAAPQTSPEPAAVEGAPAVPSSASSSAASDPSADAVERDRQRLRAEVATWHLSHVRPDEIEHIITKHSYAKARQLLWAQRRPAPREPALAAD
jgi:hypothetical protein